MKKILILLTATFIITSSAGSCKKDSPAKPPDIFLNGSLFTVSEDAPSGTVSIPVSLSALSGKEVSVNFTITDSTAISGTDYSGQASGTLTFEPGKLSKTITINILADTARK